MKQRDKNYWHLHTKQHKIMEREEYIKKLEEYYDTSCGAWCIDQDPHTVDINWVRENAWQLKPIDNSPLCTDCKTCPLKER